MANKQIAVDVETYIQLYKAYKNSILVGDYNVDNCDFHLPKDNQCEQNNTKKLDEELIREYSYPILIPVEYPIGTLIFFFDSSVLKSDYVRKIQSDINVNGNINTFYYVASYSQSIKQIHCADSVENLLEKLIKYQPFPTSK